MTISFLAGLGLLVLVTHLACELWIERVARAGRLHTLDAIPDSVLIVVLGCPPHTRGGKPNPLFTARVAAAAAAYHHKPGRRILCSGRLAPGGLHEAEELAKRLAEADVSPQSIDLDPESHRTIDSIRYLLTHHAQESILLVTQPFHLSRAIFLARRAGLEAAGLPAGGSRPSARIRLRETLARVRAVAESLPRCVPPPPRP